MTKAEETFFDKNKPLISSSYTHLFNAMAVHAKEFAEWLGKNWWVKIKGESHKNDWIQTRKMSWEEEERSTTEELYEQFNNGTN